MYLYVCVKERHEKRHREKKRKNERHWKRGRDRERKKESKCVGVHIIIPHIHVQDTTLTPEGTVTKYCSAGNFLFDESVKIGQADLRLNRECELPPPGLVPPSI